MEFREETESKDRSENLTEDRLLKRIIVHTVLEFSLKSLLFTQ